MPISLPVIIPADKSAVLYLFTNASFNACSHILLIRPQSNIELNESLSSPVITPTDKAPIPYCTTNVTKTPLLFSVLTPADKVPVLYSMKTYLSSPVITPVD